MELLQVEKVTKYYGSGSMVTKALDGISFSMEKGEFTAVMGASGSGKSTLLNVIATIDRISAGNIRIEGKSIVGQKENFLSAFRRDKLGFIFQEYNLLDTLTIEENIELPLNLKRLSAKESEKRRNYVAKGLGITDQLKKFPHELSGGQRQRAACARALITDPALILADEPTGALDSANSRNLMKTFVQMNEKLGSTILMVTHDTMVASFAKMYLAMFAVFLVLFHVAIARSLVNLLLKNRTFGKRGTNTFVLRQLSGQMRANSWMAGILSFLIAFSMIGANVSFAQKTSEETALNRYVPFDIIGTLEPDGTSEYSEEEAEAIIGQYGEIVQKTEWRTYMDGKGEMTHGYTEFTGEGYQNLTDTFMTFSDFNCFAEAAGYPTVSSDHQFYILRDMTFQADFSDAVLTRNGMTCTFGGILENYPRAAFVYFIILIPDEMAKGMTVENEFVGFQLKEAPTDAASLRKDLTYQEREEVSEGEWDTYERCDYRIKEYSRIQNNSTSAILVVGALYAAAVFVFLSMAILALKTLADMSEDQKKYQILFRLGTGEKEERRALFRQIFSFFFLPFGIPFLLSVPTAMICAELMKTAGYPELVAGVYRTAGGIAAVLLGIYVLYFAATYLIAKRNVL